MTRPPPRSTRTYTLFPYTTRCRSIGGAGAGAERVVRRGGTARRSGEGAGAGGGPDGAVARGVGGRLADRRGEEGAAGGRITDWVRAKTQGHEGTTLFRSC